MASVAPQVSTGFFWASFCKRGSQPRPSPSRCVWLSFYFLFSSCTAALAAEQALASKLPIQNPGFEEGRMGWGDEPFERFPESLALDNQKAHTGNVSLRISHQTGAESTRLEQVIGGVEGRATYVFRAWVMAAPGPPGSVAALGLEFANPIEQITSRHQVRRAPGRLGNWEALELQARADPDSDRVTVVVRLFGPGTVWFDDLELIQVEPPPQIWLTPERQVVNGGKNVRVSLLAHLAAAWESEDPPPLSFTMKGPPRDKAFVPAADLKRLDSRTVAVTLKVPTMLTGRYQVEMALPKVHSKARALIFVPVVRRRPANLTETGVFLASGKPFLPLGLCHVGPADYETIAKQGFNCVQGIAAPEVGPLQRALNLAATARLMVDVPLYAGSAVEGNLAASMRRLNRFGKSPTVLSWKIMDEPDLHPEIMDEVPRVYQALREVDRNHALALSVATPEQYAYWANFCDALHVTARPRPSLPLAEVGARVRQAVAAVEPWQNVTAVLPTWWSVEGGGQPTAQEARVMAYLALINGAKGLFWYAFRDFGFRLETTPLWEPLGALNRELSELASPLLEGVPTEGLSVESDAEGLQWLARTLSSRTYILLANPTPGPLQVTLTPQSKPSQAEDLRGEMVALEGAKARVTLAAGMATTVVLTAE